MDSKHPSQLPSRDELMDCDVAGVQADLSAMDALAYAALTARRLGCRIYLRHASRELKKAIDLVGLAAVLPCAPASGVEPRRQAEQGEDPLRVEEERDSADPTT
jgi:hypothetical protein